MLVSDTLRESLTAKIPGADFSRYFAFIESCTIAEGERHHILPKKEFPEHRKSLDNLIRITAGDHLRAHYWIAICAPECESFQRAFFMMANMKRALQVDIGDLPKYAEIYEKGRKAQRIAASAQGKIQGRVAVDSGLLASLRTPEHQKEAGRAAGRKAVKNGHLPAAQEKARKRLIEMGWYEELGRRNVESGFIQALGRDQGRKNVENGHLASLRTPEHQAAAGRARGQQSRDSGWAKKLGEIYGKRAAEGGHIQRLGRIQGRIQGPIQGRKNAEDGTLERARHIRWHVKRGIGSPACALCQKPTFPII